MSALVELVRREGDRRDQRDPRLDERLRLAQVVQLRHVGRQAALGGVRRVERPVAGAVVVVVVDVARGVVDPRVRRTRDRPTRLGGRGAVARRGELGGPVARRPSPSTSGCTTPRRRCRTAGTRRGGSPGSTSARRGRLVVPPIVSRSGTVLLVVRFDATALRRSTPSASGLTRRAARASRAAGRRPLRDPSRRRCRSRRTRRRRPGRRPTCGGSPSPS